MQEFSQSREGIPFVLPERSKARQIRKVDTRELKGPGGPRTMPMKGFEDTYTDIVD